MNLATFDGDCNDLLFANFNQDFSSMAIGGRYGYKILGLNSFDKLDEIFSDDIGDVCLVERLFSTSLIALVTLSSPRKLQIFDFMKKPSLYNYSYSSTILNVKCNMIRMVVLLEESLYIYNIEDMSLLHTIGNTPLNQKGICALSPTKHNSLLAYPGSPNTGEVQIFDVATLKGVTMIHAHNNPLAAIVFNENGSRLATASDKGTVIRVFSVADGRRLFEFRRGVKRCVNICSLAFSADSLFLASSSNTETVHLFKLDHQSSNCIKEQQPPCNEPTDLTWMDYFNKVLSTSTTYLPTQVSDMLTQDRAFAVVKLPFSGLKTVCALRVMQSLMRVIVASADGYLYIYNLDTRSGGECTLIRQHKLDVGNKISFSAENLTLLRTTYADATRGKNQRHQIKPEVSKITTSTKNITNTSSSNTTCSPQTQTYYNTLTSSEEQDNADRLRLRDVNEFPPMN